MSSIVSIQSKIDFIKVPETSFYETVTLSDVDTLMKCFILWANLFWNSQSKPWAFTYDKTGQSCVIGKAYHYDVTPGVGELDVFVYFGTVR